MNGDWSPGPGLSPGPCHAKGPWMTPPHASSSASPLTGVDASQDLLGSPSARRRSGVPHGVLYLNTPRVYITIPSATITISTALSSKFPEPFTREQVGDGAQEREEKVTRRPRLPRLGSVTWGTPPLGKGRGTGLPATRDSVPGELLGFNSSWGQIILGDKGSRRGGRRARPQRPPPPTQRPPEPTQPAPRRAARARGPAQTGAATSHRATTPAPGPCAPQNQVTSCRLQPHLLLASSRSALSFPVSICSRARSRAVSSSTRRASASSASYSVLMPLTWGDSQAEVKPTLPHQHGPRSPRHCPTSPGPHQPVQVTGPHHWPLLGHTCQLGTHLRSPVSLPAPRQGAQGREHVYKYLEPTGQ